MTQERLDAIKARCEAATPGRRYYERESCAIMTGNKFLFIEGADATDADVDFERHALDDCQSLLAEVERLREAQRWIPVEERLPEDDTSVHKYETVGLEACSVLACGYYTGSSTPSVQEVNRLRVPRTGIECLDKVAKVLDEWYWSNSFERVTHWMPLPDLPEQPAPDGVGRKEG